MARRIGWLVAIFMLFPNSPTHAASDGTLVYICIEERSAGWGREANGEYKVGAYKHSDGKFFVRFKPYKWEGLASDRHLVLPQVEITKDRVTSTYQSTLCDQNGRQNFPRYSAQDRDKSCEDLLNSELADVQFFGSEIKSFEFIPSLDKGERGTTYTNSILVGAMGAWLTGGSCVLAD